MNGRTCFVNLSVVALLILSVAGCGGGGSSKPTIGVTVTPSATQAIDEGQQVSISAAVSNDTASAGVSWSVAGGGTLSGQSTTGVTFVAPTSGAAGSGTVTATSITDTTKSASVKINYTPAPTITTATLPNGTLGTAYSQTVMVTGGAGTLAFSVAAGALPPGLSLNTATGAITGTPTGVPNVGSFTIKVTDSSTAGPQSFSQSLSITIMPPPPPAITTTTLPNAPLFNAYSAGIQATGFAPLSYAVTAGALPPGLTLNSTTGAITGAPQGPVGTSNFTITVSDASTPPQTGSANLSIDVTVAAACATGNEGLLSATAPYAFLLQGADANGPAALIGSLAADGAGGITGGVLDSNAVAGSQTDATITAGSYQIGADNRGCMTLTAGGVTRTFRFVADLVTSGTAGGARIVQFDTSGAVLSGVMRQQTTSAFNNTPSTGISGNYIFEVDGLESTTPGAKLGIAGVFDMSGTSVTGVADVNDSGAVDGATGSWPSSPLAISSGTYAVTTNGGRGTLSFAAGTGPTRNAVIYALYYNEFILMSSDAQNVNPLFSGTALQQTGTPYTLSSLGPQGIVAYIAGTSGTAGSQAQIGVITADGGGNYNFSGDHNNAGAVGTLSSSGTYTVDGTTGRVLFKDSGGTTPTLVMYLYGPGTGFQLSSDAAVLTGFAEPQAGAPFSNSVLATGFRFGTLEPMSPPSTVSVGVFTFDGKGNLTGITDTDAAGVLSIGNSVATKYTVSSNGRTVLPATGTPQTIMYVISSIKAAFFDAQTATKNPVLTVMEP